MSEIKTQQRFTGERALFKSHDLVIRDCVFEDGESPLKEGANLDIADTIFRWKYPLWYCESVEVRHSILLEMARAGMWYGKGLVFEDCTIEAPKGFRRCDGVTIARTAFADAAETLWSCRDVTLQDVSAKGNYFAMNCENVRIDGFQLVGDYGFDGCRGVEVANARMASKDAFWNCENVTVRDSFITGEYIGWNSRNLVFENCTIESLQGFCYIEGLVLRNCRLINTTRSFEYCTGIDADVATTIDSVVNPSEGVICAAGFGEVVQDDPAIDPSSVHLIVREG